MPKSFSLALSSAPLSCVARAHGVLTEDNVFMSLMEMTSVPPKEQRSLVLFCWLSFRPHLAVSDTVIPLLALFLLGLKIPNRIMMLGSNMWHRPWAVVAVGSWLSRPPLPELFVSRL